MAIERYSSRGHALGGVLSDRLTGAKRYLRIAGYFRSSLLEVVGEAIETVEDIRVVCNGDLDPHDVKVARAAREGTAAVARTLVSSWQANEQGIDVLLARERYKRLHDLLTSGKMKVRVVPRDGGNVFVHGKAGVIEHPDGREYSFVGSLNDSATGLRHAYEILWTDDDPAAAQWVRAEFDYFWNQGIDLPDAVVQHVGAMAKRGEYRSIEEARQAGKGTVPTEAILADRPIYKTGQILRPWQKRFVETCVEDYRLHGSARFLIADDVGLGKTLSMAAAALVLSMLDTRPVLILAPSTLIWQWQEELEDKLGIPAAVWSTQKKCWLDSDKRALTQKGDATLVAKCPWRIGIVSTGLIVNGDDLGERGALSKKPFGVVILDEAHKARTRRQARDGDSHTNQNNLMKFLQQISARSGTVLLGTATPIQLDAVELWDLMAAIGQGAAHVLGSPFNGSDWWRDTSIQYLSGQRPWPQDETARWSLFRNPLPPAGEHAVCRNVRDDFSLAPSQIVGPRFDELSSDVRSDLADEFETLSQQHNPIVRRVIRRTRPMLEARDLLKPVAVLTHPKLSDGLPSNLFDGEGLTMSLAFNEAYRAAERFCELYAARQPGAGFLKTILLRRIGSSAKAGLDTARHLLNKTAGDLIPEEETGDEWAPAHGASPEGEELQLLRDVERNLASVVDGHDTDPKVKVVLHFLANQQWLEKNGAIIFSQYLTTAVWVAEALCEAFPTEPVAVYGGGSTSFIQQGEERRAAGREQIKNSVQNGDVRLLCATDAACEGLNLQKLGAQVNVDMPWNPSRLIQRKGRVQRIGQARDAIHVLSMRYAGTVEDEVYAALSARYGDIFNVLGQLPDEFEDNWVDAVLRDREAVRHFSQRISTVKPAMELRYMRDVADDQGLDWEYAERVLSSRDIDAWMREGW